VVLGGADPQIVAVREQKGLAGGAVKIAFRAEKGLPATAPGFDLACSSARLERKIRDLSRHVDGERKR
jgi:hypothetical protein